MPRARRKNAATASEVTTKKRHWIRDGGGNWPREWRWQKPDYKELKKEESNVGHVRQGCNGQTLDVDWERSIKGRTFHSLDTGICSVLESKGRPSV